MPDTIRLRGMTWSDPRGYDPLVAASSAFRERHPNVDIVWDKRSLQEFESTPVEELASAYDLIIIDHPHVGAVVEKNCLLPIDRFGDQDKLAQLFAETVGKSFQSYFYKDHQWALPVDAACQVQALRPDLLTAPAPRFDDVLAEAKKGRVVWPLRAPHVLMSFFTLLANHGAPFPVTRHAQIDSTAARDVIAAMQTLVSLVDPACFDMDPIAALDALADGDQFALCPFVYLYAPYGRVGYRSHRIAFHDMPSLGASGPLGSALGGTGIAVSSGTKHPEICTDFALWVASSDIQRGLYSQNNGQPGNAVAWGNPSVNAPVGGLYNNTRMTHEAAWLRPRHAGYMAFQEDASEILLDLLREKTTPDAALPALQNRLDESFCA
ncbi:extracellular solute-binding protein [Thalassospira lohafexi]|uniref:ABC transporter substrate-binding protein n=1 Tax=Thalassospira lohafexi TaxID=744227 RepID=A0A2N3LBS9_9PROT|nr:extracellular solute-binding protein [Thalassospira lohafexi]PKR60216.1 ABC transporter substrate-binding protein [Thalassospira lohafexi]